MTCPQKKTNLPSLEKSLTEHCPFVMAAATQRCAMCTTSSPVTIKVQHAQVMLPFCSEACSKAFCAIVVHPRTIGARLDGELPAHTDLEQQADVLFSRWDDLPAETRLVIINKMRLVDLFRAARARKEFASTLEQNPNGIYSQLIAEVAPLFGVSPDIVLPGAAERQFLSTIHTRDVVITERTPAPLFLMNNNQRFNLPADPTEYDKPFVSGSLPFWTHATDERYEVLVITINAYGRPAPQGAAQAQLRGVRALRAFIEECIASPEDRLTVVGALRFLVTGSTLPSQLGGPVLPEVYRFTTPAELFSLPANASNIVTLSKVVGQDDGHQQHFTIDLRVGAAVLQDLTSDGGHLHELYERIKAMPFRVILCDSNVHINTTWLYEPQPPAGLDIPVIPPLPNMRRVRLMEAGMGFDGHAYGLHHPATNVPDNDHVGSFGGWFLEAVEYVFEVPHGGPRVLNSDEWAWNDKDHSAYMANLRSERLTERNLRTFGLEVFWPPEARPFRIRIQVNVSRVQFVGVFGGVARIHYAYEGRPQAFIPPAANDSTEEQRKAVAERVVYVSSSTNAAPIISRATSEQLFATHVDPRSHTLYDDLKIEFPDVITELNAGLLEALGMPANWRDVHRVRDVEWLNVTHRKPGLLLLFCDTAIASLATESAEYTALDAPLFVQRGTTRIAQQLG